MFPDPEADQGHHRLTTVLHAGADIAAAIEDGYRTNLPERIVYGAHTVVPLVTMTDPAVVIESVKLAEDRSGDVVVRAYESLGAHAAPRWCQGSRPRAHGRWTCSSGTWRRQGLT